MDVEANRRQAGETPGAEWPTAFDETTPADRAGWEASLAGEAQETVGPEAAAPQDGEDHSTGPPTDPDDLAVPK